MARIEVPMPQMGESIAEGTVSVWLKKVGDRVERDEPIMEISTDKVDAEIPSPVAGVLVEIVVTEGQTVEVGTVVAYIETEAGATAAAAPTAPSAPASEAATVPGERETALPEAAVGQPETPAATGGPAAEPPAAIVAAAGASSLDGPHSLEDRLRTRSTPLVRKIAAEHGVQVHDVPGTGRNGRVTKEDILRFVEERRAAPAGAGGAPGQPRRPAGPAYEGGFPWDEYY